jgi:outer membrane scaffolding protein for murein synthesis (MipA/OmpV family)
MQSIPTPRRIRSLAALCGLVLLALCLVLAPHKASAQTPSPLGEWQFSAGVGLREMFETPIPKWEASFGPAVDYQSRYEGSNSYKFEPGLALDVRYRNIAFLSTGEGLGINLLHAKNYRAGFAITYDLGRDQDDLHHLRGLDSLSTAPEAKVFAEYVFFPVVTRIDIRRGFGGNNGWIGDLSAYMPVMGSKKFFLFAGPTIAFADSTYMRNNYGVTAQEAPAVHLRQFSPGSGLKDVGFGLSATWILSDRWFVTADAAIERLLGDAAESPVAADSNVLGIDGSFEYKF